MLIEEFLRFVDLGGQVRAATTIGVVEQHELAVVLADLVLGKSSLARGESCQWRLMFGCLDSHTQVAGSRRPRDGTCAGQILCVSLAKCSQWNHSA